MNRVLPTNYMIYDTTYGHEIPAEQFFVIKFDKLPSKYGDSKIFYANTIIKELESIGFVEECKVHNKSRREDTYTQSLFVCEEKQLMVKVNCNVDNIKNDLIQVEFLYDIKNSNEELKKIIEIIKVHEKKKRKANIKLIKSDMGHLDTEDYDLLIPPIELELNYGKNFLKVHNVILKKLNENNGKGIILLHGDPGTGKTSYIKYLTSLIKEKDILFIPPSMAEMLSEPSIIPFLMEHKNSILIIEDAERVIGDRENNGSSAGVSNILNLTDGILGDCLSIQIVATFNMRREKIDQALLRKGRLIAEYKFEKLSLEETEKLLKSLNKDHYVSEGMCLADIYNIDVEVFKTNKTTKIGF